MEYYTTEKVAEHIQYVTISLMLYKRKNIKTDIILNLRQKTIYLSIHLFI